MLILLVKSLRSTCRALLLLLLLALLLLRRLCRLALLLRQLVTPLTRQPEHRRDAATLQRLGVLVDGGAEGFGISRVNKGGLDTKARKGVGKQVSIHSNGLATPLTKTSYA